MRQHLWVEQLTGRAHFTRKDITSQLEEGNFFVHSLQLYVRNIEDADKLIVRSLHPLLAK